MKILSFEEYLELVMAHLESDAPPREIAKPPSYTLAGNVSCLMPVLADRRGRLWREETHRIVLISQSDDASEGDGLGSGSFPINGVVFSGEA